MATSPGDPDFPPRNNGLARPSGRPFGAPVRPARFHPNSPVRTNLCPKAARDWDHRKHGRAASIQGRSNHHETQGTLYRIGDANRAELRCANALDARHPPCGIHQPPDGKARGARLRLIANQAGASASAGAARTARSRSPTLTGPGASARPANGRGGCEPNVRKLWQHCFRLTKQNRPNGAIEQEYLAKSAENLTIRP